MTSAVGNYLQRNDVELLRAFPATTSAANAASAISRAIYTSRNDKLSPDAIDAAKRTLASMNTKPSHESLAGLVDAATHGIGALDIDTFVLSSGVWRALVAHLEIKIQGATMLQIIQMAISSAVPLVSVIPDDAKYIRISKFYLNIAIKFTQALGTDVTPDLNITKPFFTLYKKIIQLKLVQEFHKMLVRLLKDIFIKIPVNTWRSAFIPNSEDEGDIYGSLQLTLYFVRCATSITDGNDDDFEWKKKCEQSLSTEIVPYLFDAFATLKLSSLLEKKLGGASILSVVTASIVNTCLYLDTHRGGVIEILLCRVSSPCIISSLVASFALAELYKYRDMAGQKRIRDLVYQCLKLLKAVHSLHATQRWEPLLQRLEKRNLSSIPVLPTADLSSASKLPVLQRARLIHTRITAGADPKLTNDVRAGLQVSSSPVCQAIHALVRRALDDENNDKDMKEHLTLLAKHLPNS